MKIYYLMKKKIIKGKKDKNEENIRVELSQGYIVNMSINDMENQNQE